MEFKSLKNIETSFRQIRLFGIVFLCLCALVSVFSVVASFRFAEKQREKIYVLDGGKSLMLALSQDLSQNRPVEAREHIRRFHELFFTLSPDRAAIESNINRALFLVDKSAFAYYQDMQEKGYYNRVGEHQPAYRGGLRGVRLQRLSLPGHDLCPANDCPREQHHRAFAGHALRADQLGAFGQ